jgi:hypothetical protein
MSDDIDMLCDMMASQPLWCPHENTLDLLRAIRKTELLIQEGSTADPGCIQRHAQEVKHRYATMLRAAEDWLACQFLRPLAQRCLQSDDEKCLYMSFYIDHELLRLCDIECCDVVAGR